MTILALDRPRPGVTFEKYRPYMMNEVRHTWGAYKKGVIRDVYFREDRPGVAIVMECASVDEAQSLCADFPLAKAGLLDFELVPLGPFTDWEMLFSQSGK